jgi:hemerythrin-like metal-binding protein
MTHLGWKKKYELGVEDIDLQHHYFLNLINRIADEVKKSEDKQYIESLAAELNAYARFHFISEETMMLHAGYPDYEEHRQCHFELLEQLGIEQYNLIHDPSETEVDRIITFLLEWFVDHTTGVDKEFATYLKERKA